LGIGTTYRDPVHRHVDAASGREITQLTDYRGHSFQFYFTHPCWLDSGAFLFTSDRANHRDLFRRDPGGSVSQLTDSSRKPIRAACLSPETEKVYFWSGIQLCELNLGTLTSRVLCEVPKPMRGERPSVAAGGQALYVQLYEAHPADLTTRYGPPTDGGSRSRFDRQPLSQIVRIELDSGDVEVLHEDHRYISHVNASPTRPNLVTFCHEGPWELVDQRIWCVDTNTKSVTPIRPQNGEFSVVAEHWLSDGERIGFRSHKRSAGDTRFGYIRYDNVEHVEAELGAYSRHFHSHDGSLVVGDGSPIYPLPSVAKPSVTWPYILLYPWEGDRYGDPRILAEHGSSFNGDHAHCHPRFTLDGQQVMYTSDTSGYANIYLVDVGDLDELPVLRIED